MAFIRGLATSHVEAGMTVVTLADSGSPDASAARYRRVRSANRVMLPLLNLIAAKAVHANSDSRSQQSPGRLSRWRQQLVIDPCFGICSAATYTAQAVLMSFRLGVFVSDYSMSLLMPFRAQVT